MYNTIYILQEKPHGSNAESIIAKVKKPTQAEAKALATYFPSSKSASKRALVFDPAAESVVLPMQKKKKCATKRQRPCNVTVILMKEFSPKIPKGKIRQRLASKGRILSLRISRSMTNQEVKNQVVRAFKVDKFVVLECDSTGHNLVKAADQSIDGEKAVDRKGGLYLCEKFEYVSGQNMLHARYKVQR